MTRDNEKIIEASAVLVGHIRQAAIAMLEAGAPMNMVADLLNMGRFTENMAGELSQTRHFLPFNGHGEQVGSVNRCP